MIGIVDVEIQAANPQMPLYPMRAFVNSPSSVRVRNVPTEVGAWKITSVRVVVAYPDSSIKTADCVLAGSVWVATVAGCAVSGKTENGFTVFASGVDENGSAVSNYCLGKGNVEILKADGTLSPDAPSYYVHLFDEEPTAPNEGDMWPTSGGFVIWHDGEAHGSITVDFALSATSENPVQNKVVTAAVNARPTKAQMDEGWWSEWTVSPSAPVGKRFYFEFSSSGQLNVFLGDEGGLDPSLPPTITITPATGEETELQFDEDSIEYTATRHRVAAPVPTRPEDIGAQPHGDYYQKPSGGIPKTDLASAVQTSLGKADTAVQPSGITWLMPMYGFTQPPVIDGVLTVLPYTGATYTATYTAAAFEIAVGALPAGVTGKVRDCILVIDCTATGAVAPTVTWGTHFHPRTDTATDLAIVEAGKRAVFYISEYAAGEFAVGGWVETVGGSGT